MVDLKEYLPDCYEEIVDAQTQQEALSIEVDKLQERYEQALLDQFVQHASHRVIGYYENIFKIVADPSVETLEFRRERVLSRMKALTPPYSYYYFRILLDGFFGAGHYKLDIDNDNYTITLESAVEDSLWYHEIQVSITAVKPCNMIFINTPRVSKVLSLGDTIYAQRVMWNYKLNGEWKLGLRPFFSIDAKTIFNYTLNGNWRLGEQPFTKLQGDIVKMATTQSLQQPLFDFTLNQYKWKFYKARLNDSIDIVIEDGEKSISLDTITLGYSVARNQVENITNIKLLDADDNVLESANVFIPVPDRIRLVHTLKIKEDE